MKKLVSLLLVMAMLLTLTGCDLLKFLPGFGEKTPETVEPALPVETAAPPMEEPAVEATTAETTTETTTQETEPAAVKSEGSLFLKVSSITFSVVGESEDIYLGMIPREEVTWESDDPSVVSVENGVLTANGVSTTTIRAVYGEQQVECTAGCLASTQEELEGLGFESGNVSYELKDSSAGKDEVISQPYQKGEMVDITSKIVLVISKGSKSSSGSGAPSSSNETSERRTSPPLLTLILLSRVLL